MIIMYYTVVSLKRFIFVMHNVFNTVYLILSFFAVLVGFKSRQHRKVYHKDGITIMDCIFVLL